MPPHGERVVLFLFWVWAIGALVGSEVLSWTFLKNSANMSAAMTFRTAMVGQALSVKVTATKAASKVRAHQTPEPGGQNSVWR